MAMTLFQRLSCVTRGAQQAHNRFRKGLTSIEFALIAPAFFLIFIGLIEMSLMMLAQHLIENATFNASRLAKTGFIAEGKTQLETVMDVINRELGSLSPLINSSRVTFTSTVYGQITDIDVPEQGVAGLGTAEDIVVYTISYPWQVFTPLMNDIIGDQDGIIRLTSRIVVRNEPYD